MSRPAAAHYYMALISGPNRGLGWVEFGDFSVFSDAGVTKP